MNNAIEIIRDCIALHKAALIESLGERLNQDAAVIVASDWRPMTQTAARGSHKATMRAIGIVQVEQPDLFAKEIGPGVITLNIACKLLDIAPHVRTSAAVNTWGDC
jgi:hypothetical protein